MARDGEKILTDPTKNKRLNIKNKDAKEGGKGITLALATNLSFSDIIEQAYKNSTWETGVRPMLSRFTIIQFECGEENNTLDLLKCRNQIEASTPGYKFEECYDWTFINLILFFMERLNTKVYIKEKDKLSALF